MRYRKCASHFAAFIVNQLIIKMNSVTDEEMMEKQELFQTTSQLNQMLLEMIQ